MFVYFDLLTEQMLTDLDMPKQVAELFYSYLSIIEIVEPFYFKPGCYLCL